MTTWSGGLKFFITDFFIFYYIDVHCTIVHSSIILGHLNFMTPFLKRVWKGFQHHVDLCDNIQYIQELNFKN